MGVLLFVGAFLYWLGGLSGSIPSYRDSGDLIASIHTLGIAHPPGYASYVVLGHLFDHLLKLGSPSYRVNVLSALSMAGALTLLSLRFSSRLLRERFASQTAIYSSTVAAAVAWTVIPSVTELARVAEMYATAALCASLVITLLFSEQPRFAAAAFVWSVGFSIHPVLLFLVPLFFTYEKPDWPGLALGALLGFSTLAFLPIRATHHPMLNWGDPSSWRTFWRVITRADYGGLKLHPEESVFVWTAEGVMGRVIAFLQTYWKEWSGWGFALGLIGLVFSLQSRIPRRWIAGWTAAWLLSGPLFVILSNLPLKAPTTAPILQPYLVLSTLLWIPFVAWALVRTWIWRRWAGIAGVLVTIGWALAQGHGLSHRNDFYAYDYGRNLLRSLPPQAVLFDPDDPTAFTLHTLQTTEGMRTDVALLNFFRTRWGYQAIVRQWPDLLPGVAVSNAQELERLFWTYSVHQRPFFVELPQKLGSIPSRAEGLVYAVMPETSEATANEIAEQAFVRYVIRGNAVTSAHNDFFTRHLIDYYAAAHCNVGLQEASSGRTDDAVSQYKQALRFDPELSAAYNNWGILEFNARRYRSAVNLYERALAIDPDNEGLKRNLLLAKTADPAATPAPRKLTF